MPQVFIASLEEKQPKNMWTKLGPRGTNGSGNGCYDNGKKKSTKGITNTYERKCVWHWIMWAYSLADSDTIFEPGKKCFSIYHMQVLFYAFYGKEELTFL